MGTFVKFSLALRKNPVNPSASPKFYATAQSSGERSLDEMSRSIEKLCTVTRPDVLAVLAALQITIKESLCNGEIVRLGDVGSFRVGLSGKGTLTEKEFSPLLIKKARVIFKPSKEISNVLKTLNYAHVAKLPVKVKAENKPESSQI